MKTKTVLIAAALLMAVCQAGCEYYSTDPAAIDAGGGGKTLLPQGSGDEVLDADSQEIEDLKKEMAAANDEEVKALQAKIAELEKKSAGGSGGGTTTGGGTATGGTTTGGTTTGGGEVQAPTAISSLTTIKGTWKATTFIVTDHTDSKKYDQLKAGYSFKMTIADTGDISFETTKPDQSKSTAMTKISVPATNTLKLEEQPEPFTAALTGTIMTWTGWKDEKDPIEAVWQKE